MSVEDFIEHYGISGGPDEGVPIPVGEHPDVTIARVVSEMDELRAELKLVTQERDELLAKIDTVSYKLHTAQGLNYRSGW